MDAIGAPPPISRRGSTEASESSYEAIESSSSPSQVATGEIRGEGVGDGAAAGVPSVAASASAGASCACPTSSTILCCRLSAFAKRRAFPQSR